MTDEPKPVELASDELEIKNAHPGTEDNGAADKASSGGGGGNTGTIAVTASDDDAGQDMPLLPFSKGKSAAMVLTVAGAAFLNTLSAQAVVIILPTIGDELDIPESRQQWIVSAYSLTFGCFLLLWGRIADIYGRKLMFVGGSAFVAVTTIANPFMPNEISFDLFRGLAGLGAAANVPTALGILGSTFPPSRYKNYAFSTYAAGAPLGSVFGNLVGGLIASYADWKWVFGCLGGIAIVVTAAGIVFIPAPPPVVGARKEGESLFHAVDWIGGFLITAGVLALLFALTEGNVVGWKTVWIYMLMVIAFFLIAAFGAWEWYQEAHTTRAPLMKMSVFKNGLFIVAMVIMAVFFAAFNDFLFFATYYWQGYQGLSPIQTTLRFIPTGVGGFIMAAIVSRLISIVPTYALLMFGSFAEAVACLLFAVPIPPATTSYFAYGLPATILSVIGADATWPCLTLFTSEVLPQADQALGGALINAAGQVGRAVALAVATAIQTAVTAEARGVPVEQAGTIVAWERASLDGIRAASYFNFVLALCSCAVAGLAFRGTGIVGHQDKKKKKPTTLARGGDEEGGVTDEEAR